MRNIVESGEEMRFENEEIHFKTSLTIEGSVVYENCKIFCYEDGCEASIDLEGEGELTFRGCEIVFCGAKGDNEYFIDNVDGTLEMEDCKVRNANYFATGSESAKLDVSGCEFLNGVQNLFVSENSDDESHISDCKFDPGFYRYESGRDTRKVHREELQSAVVRFRRRRCTCNRQLHV